MMRVHSGNFLYTLNKIRQSLFAFLQSELARLGIHDISPSHGDILYIMYRKDGLNMRDLSRLALKDKSTITSVINHLAKSGYVVKRRDAADRRLVSLETTPKAYRMRPELNKVSEKMNSRLFGGLSEEEKETLFRLMARISDNADKLQ